MDFFSQLPGLLGPLQNLFQSMPSITPTLNNLQNQFGGLPSQLQQQFGGLPQQLQNQFGGLPSQLTGMAHNLGTQFSALPSQLLQSTQPLRDTSHNYLAGILRSQGALSPEASRDVAQQTRQLASQYGTGRQLGTLGTELLNRQSTREARYNTALGQYNAATGQVGLLDQLAQGLGTNLATTRAGLLSGAQQLGTNLATTRQGLGTSLAQVRQELGGGLAQLIQGLTSQDVATRSGLAGSIQNLQSGGLNQLLGVQSGNVSGFSQLTNPMLSYLSNLFSGNLQSRIAQAQINQQGNIANQNKMGGAAGGAISAIGSIAPLLMMSDERMKTKIKDAGVKTAEGIPLKTWEYKTNPGKRFLSPLAQDVEAKLPERVLTDPVSGVKFITGFPVVEVSPLKRKAA